MALFFKLNHTSIQIRCYFSLPPNCQFVTVFRRLFLCPFFDFSDSLLYIERRHYDYNAIEDPRLPGFKRYLRNLKYGFPCVGWERKVKEYVRLMNFWYAVPHWDYDIKKLCFIEISDSKEHDEHQSNIEEPRTGSVIRIID